MLGNLPSIGQFEFGNRLMLLLGIGERTAVAMLKLIGLLAVWVIAVHGTPYRSPINSFSIASEQPNYDYDTYPQNDDSTWDELVEAIQNEPAMNMRSAAQVVQTQPSTTSTTSTTVTPQTQQKTHKHRILHGVGR